MSKYLKRAKDPNKPKRPACAFFIFMEAVRKELNYTGAKKVADVGKAAGERWKSLSESDKAPYVLKAQKLKAEYDKKMLAYTGKLKGVEDGTEDKLEESDKSMANKSQFDKSMAEKSKFDKSTTDKLKSDKLQSNNFVSSKLESEGSDDHKEESKRKKVNNDNLKKITVEDELQTILEDFARFEAVYTPINPIVPPKATNLHKHLNELEKLISLPLETLLQSANLFQLQIILRQVKALPLVDAKLREWCCTLLEVTMVMPKQRINIHKVLMEAEVKAQAIVELQKEATDIRKTTLHDIQLKKEYSTSIQRVDAKIKNLKRQLIEAKAERATLTQLKEDLATTKFQRLKRARVVRDDLAPLIEENAAINKSILDGKNAIRNIDNHLNALIVQFNVLKNAC